MFRSTNRSMLVGNKDLGMIHAGSRIATESYENTPLRQTKISENQRSTLASRAATLRRRGASSIFGSTTFSPLRSWRWSGIVPRSLLVVLLVFCSTLVLSFRFVSTTPLSKNIDRVPLPSGTTKQQTSQLRASEKTLLSAQTTDFAKGGILSKHTLENINGPMKLSLWLIPSGGEEEREDNKDESKTNNDADENSNNPVNIFDRTKKVIDGLSTEHGGPRFIPHVTLGGARVESEKEALALADKLRTGLAGFGAVECSVGETALSGDTWNQALVFELVPPFEQFLGLCKASREILGMEPTNRDGDDCLTFPPPLRVPHMSLYYGKSPPSPNEMFLSEVFGSNSDKKTFRANRIMLWKTDPSSLEGVPEWEPIADISIL